MPYWKEFVNKFKKHIDRNFPALLHRTLFVACSGGVDSMVLLHLAQSISKDVTALHMNYHLRGEESNKDQQVLEDFCYAHSIPIIVNSNPIKETLLNGGNLQETARNERYNWFQKILSESSDGAILLAHHRDDQVETFYLNLARNAGVMGLACMPEKRGDYYRPLLAYSKEELIQYATDNAIQWREDASNRELKYNRNKLRNKFIPKVKESIPYLEDSILLLVNKFQELQVKLEEKAAPLRKEILSSNLLSFEIWNNLSELEQIELFRQLNLDHNKVTALNKLQTTGAKLLLPNHETFKAIVRDRSGFSFLKDVVQQVEMNIHEVAELPQQFIKNELYLDSSKVNGELQLRTWSFGDRIKPIGMNGSQLISDIIQHAKLSSLEKDQVLVLEDENEILACIGFKVGRTAIADNQTKKILRVTFTYPTTQE